MKCRHCDSQLNLDLVDLGVCPPSNAYLKKEDLNRAESFLPLRVLICESCWLVQTEDYSAASELFSPEYAYFSSFSTSWLEHSKKFVEKVSSNFNLGSNSTFIEVAANDGYLLQFVKQKGIRCLGVEPTKSTANAAREKGLEIVEEFFGVQLATSLKQKGWGADFMCANNVLAHVPNINDFVSGFAHLLNDKGVCTFEFPHVRELIRLNQFDTIYHEHYSYLSFTTVSKVFKQCGLRIFDVEQLTTHGGSLRVYAEKTDGNRTITTQVKDMFALEEREGLTSRHFYENFQLRATKVKKDFLAFISQTDKKVVGYGAAAKGNTLLNFAGIKSDLLPYIVDRNTSKIGKYTPGARIPIVNEDVLKSDKPDYVVILPWNLRSEIVSQLSYIRSWGGQFVTAVPHLEIF